MATRGNGAGRPPKAERSKVTVPVRDTADGRVRSTITERRRCDKCGQLAQVGRVGTRRADGTVALGRSRLCEPCTSPNQAPSTAGDTP